MSTPPRDLTSALEQRLERILETQVKPTIEANTSGLIRACDAISERLDVIERLLAERRKTDLPPATSSSSSSSSEDE